MGTAWVYDVQGILGEGPSWWRNPLSFVTDMKSAVKLAEVFIASETSAGAKSDAYFESDGKRLLSHFLFAAAIANRSITELIAWAQCA